MVFPAEEASCFCPKAPYMKQLLEKVRLATGGERGVSVSPFRQKLCGRYWAGLCVISKSDPKGVCAPMHSNSRQEDVSVGINLHRAAMQDPRREGEIWQKGDASFVLILFRGFQKVEEINSSQAPFRKTSLP